METLKGLKIHYQDHSSVDDYDAASYLLDIINLFNFTDRVLSIYKGSYIDSIAGDISPEDDEYKNTRDVNILSNIFFKVIKGGYLYINPISIEDLNELISSEYELDNIVGPITIELNKDLYLHLNFNEKTYAWSKVLNKPGAELESILKESRHILLFEQYINTLKENTVFKRTSDWNSILSELKKFKWIELSHLLAKTYIINGKEYEASIENTEDTYCSVYIHEPGKDTPIFKDEFDFEGYTASQIDNYVEKEIQDL